ncbi:MAG: phage major capsid protein [Alphaproteobacteria bacterium]|nr:MAG: phage major capsid protein [Alphaproteobacteria bacterium]
MNQINNEAILQETIHALGKSMYDSTNEIKQTINQLKQTQQIETKKIDIPQTWDSNINESIANLGNYLRSGNVGLECKNSSFESMGGYVCIPHLNQYLLSSSSYVSPIRQLASSFTVTNGNAFELLMPKDINVSENEVNNSYDNNSSMLEFNKVDINMHAFEVAVNIPDNIIHGAKPLNYHEFITHVLAKEISKHERNIFVQGIGDKIDSIIPEEANSIREKFTFSSLLKMIEKLDEEFQHEAVWLMTRKMYNQCLDLQNEAGNHLIKIDSHNLNEYLLGRRIYFVPQLEQSSCELILCNLKKGYAIAEYKDLLLMQDRYTKKPHIQTYVRKNIGAKVIDKAAFVGFYGAGASGENK